MSEPKPFAKLQAENKQQADRIRELEAELAATHENYPPNEGRTHSAGCWQWKYHHECAIRKIRELEAEVERLRNENVGLRSIIAGSNVPLERVEILLQAWKNRGER